MRGISSHGQMGKFMNDGYGRNVHRVTSVGFECADSAFTQNNFVVSAREEIFGGEQQFFECGGDASFEQDWFSNFSEFPQQVEVLHVARTNLEDVDVGHHDGNL